MLPEALLIVWLIVSAAGGVIAAAPFVAPAGMLQSIFPACESRLRGDKCVACGMTSGFIAISQGRLDEAKQANAGAAPLFVLLAANFAGAGTYLIRRLLFRGGTCNS